MRSMEGVGDPTPATTRPTPLDDPPSRPDRSSGLDRHDDLLDGRETDHDTDDEMLDGDEIDNNVRQRQADAAIEDDHLDRLVAGCGVAAVVAGLVVWWAVSIELVGPTLTPWLANLGQLFVPAVALVACWRAGQQLKHQISHETGRRRAWSLLSLSAGAWVAGQSARTYQSISGTPIALPSLADVGFLLAVPLALAALVSLPRLPVERRMRTRTALDGAIAAGALLFMGWIVVGAQAFHESTTVMEQLLAVAYPLCGVALLTTVILVLPRLTGHGRLSMLLLGGGLAALALGDASSVLVVGPGSDGATVSDATWFIAYLLFALAALRTVRRRPAVTTGGRREPGRVGLLLPYLPLAAALPVAVVLRSSIDGTAAGLTLALGALLLVRLGVAVLDNQDLARSLESARATVEHQALHDPLTGLPNRTLLFDRLHQALQRTSRSGEPLSVIFCDLDDFKSINDCFGHETGDAVLQAVAGRLHHAVRTSDTVARLGGDQFVVLCEQLRQPEGVDVVLSRVTEAVRQPVSIGEHCYEVGVSVGVVVTNDRDLTPDRVLDEADELMQRAKTHGRNEFEIVDWTLRLFTEAAAILDARH